MNEEDWREIVQMIQKELRKIGQDEIADLSNYEMRDETERSLPEPRLLVKEMLDALHRYMSARSSATIQNSLDDLQELINEGECPTEVIVWADQERSAIEGREPRERLDGDQGATQAIKELKHVIYQLGFGDRR